MDGHRARRQDGHAIGLIGGLSLTVGLSSLVEETAERGDRRRRTQPRLATLELAPAAANAARFVDATVAAAYERRIVGARHHKELWVPAEELDAFNDAIVGTIEVIQEFGTPTSQSPES